MPARNETRSDGSVGKPCPPRPSHPIIPQTVCTGVTLCPCHCITERAFWMALLAPRRVNQKWLSRLFPGGSIKLAWPILRRSLPPPSQSHSFRRAPPTFDFYACYCIYFCQSARRDSTSHMRPRILCSILYYLYHSIAPREPTGKHYGFGHLCMPRPGHGNIWLDEIAQMPCCIPNEQK